MRKLFLVAILVLGLASFVYAENSATGMNGRNFGEQQVFITAYNNSGAAISSNYVVALDITGAGVASGSTLGAYITTTATANSGLTIGITDETIAAGHSGRICVRGPHKAYVLNTTGTLVAGASLASNTTAGSLALPTSNLASGQIATLLSATPIGGGAAGGVLTGTYDGYTPGDGPNNYWVWVQKSG
jgi:hypothetical protein